MEYERRELAAKALPSLFAAWGGTDRKKRSTYPPCIELTRLALLCGNAEVAAACAADAVAGLERQFAYRQAEVGRQAIALIDARSKPVPLALLRKAGELNVLIGEVDIAETCYRRGSDRIAQQRQEGEAVDPLEEGALALAQARFLAEKGRA